MSFKVKDHCRCGGLITEESLGKDVVRKGVSVNNNWIDNCMHRHCSRLLDVCIDITADY